MTRFHFCVIVARQMLRQIEIRDYEPDVQQYRRQRHEKEMQFEEHGEIHHPLQNLQCIGVPFLKANTNLLHSEKMGLIKVYGIYYKINLLGNPKRNSGLIDNSANRKRARENDKFEDCSLIAPVRPYLVVLLRDGRHRIPINVRTGRCPQTVSRDVQRRSPVHDRIPEKGNLLYFGN